MQMKEFGPQGELVPVTPWDPPMVSVSISGFG